MDWSHQVYDSIVWLGEAFVVSLLGLTAIFLLLARYTSWGRQFSRISWAYFTPARSKLPLLWIMAIVLMTLFSVRMNILFSFWYNAFYTSMQKLDAAAFWNMLVIFAILATVHVARALFNYYLRQAFLIRWRVWLTDVLMQRWLDKQSYYRSQYAATKVDNPDQRIQQDVDSFVSSSLSLSMGLLDAVVSLFSFTIILWSLSGALQLFGFELPRAMVFLVYLYVVVATVFAVWIGRPLISLNFLNEQLNASFRYALIRLREYGESISFFHGEKVEGGTLAKRFADVIGNTWAIVFRSLKFQGFNLVVTQAAVVFPFIVQAPRLFSKQIALGDVMQTVQAFGQVQDALSFFRTSYDEFASYRAVVIRLSGFLDLIEAAEQLPAAPITYEARRFAVEALTVKTPAAVTLLANLNLSLSASAALLIRGHSGVGKTTLLRAVAGLWPYVEGKVVRPQEPASLFLPQKPYLPLGTLRTALYYPAAAVAGDEAAAILQQCHLGHLVARLDEADDWTRILSLGEQQRLAIGRVLLSRPQVIFLDEASSAMDEGLEYAMYHLLRQTLPDAILISVGHRSSLLGFHTQELELLGDGKWLLRDMPV